MMENQPQILIVDDEPVARMVIKQLLINEPYTLYFAESGIEGIARAIELQPDLILLDVMMPNLDGFAVCRQLRANDLLRDIPILLITSLDDRDSRLAGLKAGADDFISKPFDSLELLARLQSTTRLNRYRRIVEQRRELEKLHSELLIAYDKTIEGWSQALDLRDKETEGHTQRVTKKTLEMACAIGLNDEEQTYIRRGAMLHDIGKLGIPDSILLKPAKLTSEEWQVMRLHPVYAYQWLYKIEYLRKALDIPYCHHEKWNGDGYPRQLKGDQIPLAARMFAIVDVWDALRSDRPYRVGIPEAEALAYIQAQANQHFDPNLVPIFINLQKT
jgi:putative two-component system response regulator